MTGKTKKTKKPTGEPTPEATMTMSQAQAMFDELKALVAEATEFTQQVSEAADLRLNAIEARQNVAPTFSPDQRTHTVTKSDSLSLIAKRYLGNAGRFPEIVTLNQDRYPSLATNPNCIEEGWVLVIPD